MTVGGHADTARRVTRAQARAGRAKKPPLRPDLTIVQTQVFRGPNYWSYEPCIRMLVDLGSLEHWPSNTIPRVQREAAEGCCRASASTRARWASSGGFRERLEDGTWLGHVAEHVALELQRESGAHISRGKTRSAGHPGPVQRDLRLRRGDRSASRPGGSPSGS